ncbi:CDP-glycerol glycerophosphotransferase family protein [Polynucleobacter sp. 73C-SIWE]|uniref:CDP-glycerol glycerophosphotransferase family protein n=1 Tax=Polynucleobacter sp. 73C-SIWE TaxID=2689098 RepID=UPI001C0C0C1C|nr:CDP-glycerol glycerophosphotransferase family protein [Polynucleobacter sp. 73C-SIWE]
MRLAALILTRQKKNRIIFIRESASGSNSYALWKFATENDRKVFDLILMQNVWTSSLCEVFQASRLIASAKMLVSTHAVHKPTKRHINFHLWHGASIKKLGAMEDRAEEELFKPPWEKVDHIMSYSETYTTFLNACMVTDPKKYHITGAPRNDFLFTSNGIDNLKRIFKNQVGSCRLIFYFPTFRDYYGEKQGDRNYKNIFGFEEFLIDEFDDFLEKEGLKIILKPHPHEESLVLEYFKNYPLRNLLILSDAALVGHAFDLYEVLNAADLVITDYSSIYDDFLLLNRPVLFAPVDIKSYSQKRGFVIESFEDWVPGPIVFNQTSLQHELVRLLDDSSYYSAERERVKKLQHRYKDGLSSQRLWKVISEIMQPYIH